VKPALHGHHAAAFDQPEEQPALVALDRRDGEVGNLLVVDGVPDLDMVGEIAQTGAENDPRFGGEPPDLLAEKGGGLKNLI